MFEAKDETEIGMYSKKNYYRNMTKHKIRWQNKSKGKGKRK